MIITTSHRSAKKVLKNDPFWDEIRHLLEFKEIEADFYRNNEERLEEIMEKDTDEL
ncbi:MAG: hypothetical protein O6939_10485 [Bacteroidetes bacterium]|nr:hypothetical protein [Bacteroidota bacterium]